jgi:hypothetical protein
VQDPESAARASLFRSLIIYTAMLIADLTVVAWIAASDPAGPAYVTMSVVAAVGLLIAYQVYAHVRDLREPLAESEGTLRRVWTRADLIIAWHSYYVTVDRMVLRVRPEEYVLLEDRLRALGRLDPPREMYVKVVHFPRTLNVVSIHEIIRPPPDPSAIV